jgi:phosphohistidine phosphatase
VILYLLRHGIAEDAAPSGDDGDRRLTSRGQARMRVEAAAMRSLGLAFEVILTSPLARAAETAAIVAAAFPEGVEPCTIAELATGVPPPEMLRALGPHMRRHDTALAVGHEPGLSRLASLLLTGSSDVLALELKKGGLIAIEAHATRRPTTATLCWMLSPRQLRRLARR